MQNRGEQYGGRGMFKSQEEMLKQKRKEEEKIIMAKKIIA
jgi:hypothetical protein